MLTWQGYYYVLLNRAGILIQFLGNAALCLGSLCCSCVGGFTHKLLPQKRKKKNPNWATLKMWTSCSLACSEWERGAAREEIMAPKKGEKNEIQKGLLPLTGNQHSSLCAALQSEDEDRLGMGSLIFWNSAVKFLSSLWIPNHPDPTEPSCGPV